MTNEFELFEVREPAIQTIPFVYNSPHSGRRYPPSFLDESRLEQQGTQLAASLVPFDAANLPRELRLLARTVLAREVIEHAAAQVAALADVEQRVSFAVEQVDTGSFGELVHEAGVELVSTGSTAKTIADNVAFPLRLEGRPAAEVDARVAVLLDQLGHQLSIRIGGAGDGQQ